MSARRVQLPRYPAEPDTGVEGAAAADAAAGADAEPDADGWVRRYMADPKRAEEARVMYESLGFEVEFRSPDPRHVQEMSDECGECRAMACSTYVVVHTRRGFTPGGV